MKTVSDSAVQTDREVHTNTAVVCYRFAESLMKSKVSVSITFALTLFQKAVYHYNEKEVKMEEFQIKQEPLTGSFISNRVKLLVQGRKSDSFHILATF